MADEKREYAKPIYKAKGKNSFFEIYDSLGIDKVMVQIAIYDPEKENNRTTHKVSFYIDYQDFLGLSALVTAGNIDNYITEDAPRHFPKYSYTEGKNQRSWSVSKTDKGYYKVSVTEKEKGPKWEDAKLVDTASFYVQPFEFVALCKTVEMYILAKFFLGKTPGNTQVVKAVEEGDQEPHGITME